MVFTVRTNFFATDLHYIVSSNAEHVDTIVYIMDELPLQFHDWFHFYDVSIQLKCVVRSCFCEISSIFS